MLVSLVYGLITGFIALLSCTLLAHVAMMFKYNEEEVSPHLFILFTLILLYYR